MRQDLLDKINDYGQKLGAVSTWTGSGCAFGHIDKDSEDSYVFEFFCYISLLFDLKKHQDVKYNRGSNPDIFPKSPASKGKGWARFDIYDKAGAHLYQACAGTGIKLSACPKTS
ncbi:MAG: hypothetical protein IT258_15705, partial [Saprospiraceae bacterium]|nr:hypothetical protein [Saprospiraceae bacterium]